MVKKVRKSKKGMEKKKGETGIAANYITRNRAINKLQITLKDFRRLCILKGIYPRNPKKKKYGSDKTYYHIKDIKFLAHEPLLLKFRELKMFVRRYRRAVTKKEKARASTLKLNKPKLVFDHLVKERYPSFGDAVRDLDDPLCMISLFAALPAKTTKAHSPEINDECSSLSRHFNNYVYRTKALRKVFASVKGIYFQAVLPGGGETTWLTPHHMGHALPSDVDYRVMLTFLQFYTTLLRFVLFKLYKDIGLHYPPKIDELLEAQLVGMKALQVEAFADPSSSSSSSSSFSSSSTSVAAVALKKKPTAQDKKAAEEVQSKVRAVLNKLGDGASKADAQLDNQMQLSDNTNEDELDDFSKLGESDLPSVKESLSAPEDASGTVFKGLTFMLAREVPQDVLEFVILCGGGSVVRVNSLTPEQEANKAVTHHVVDRPQLAGRVILSREYIQPQWVFDSFNMRALLPVAPYKPGMRPPPHLSPFVDDEREGYVPKQREVLEQWATGGPVVEAPIQDDEEEEDEDEGDEAADIEKQHNDDLENEAAGISFSVKGVESGSGKDKGKDKGKEKKEVELGPDGKPKKRLSKRDREEQEQAMLARQMMPNKQRRLYAKMQYGIAQREAAKAELLRKRAHIEKHGEVKNKGKVGQGGDDDDDDEEFEDDGEEDVEIEVQDSESSAEEDEE